MGFLGLTGPSSSSLSSSLKRRRREWVSGEGADRTALASTTHEIFMPALSSTMKEGRIVQWTKNVGDKVDVGEVVMVVESDKADMDVESFNEGYLARKLVDEGGSANVGETVGLLAENADDLDKVDISDIPSGDGNRHDGTTAWKLPETAHPPASDADSVPQEFLSESALADVGAKEVFMPALSSTMTEGRVSKWLKSEGDRIEVGDTVMVVESDKADMDVESFEEGYLAQILVPEGESAAVGATCALIASSIEEIETVKAAGTQGIASGTNRRADGTTAVAPMPPPAAPAPVAAASPSVPTTDIFMPALSSTMTEGRVSQWQISVGDRVEVGQTVMVVESDKADMEVESFEEGYVAKILVGEGEMAAVGAPVALLVEKEGDISKAQTGGGGGAAPAATPGAPAAAAPAAVRAPAPSAPSISSPLSTFVPYSVDQDLASQLPPGWDADALKNEFWKRLNSFPEGKAYVDELSKTDKGKAELQRLLTSAAERVPPTTHLLQPEHARAGSIWQASGKARHAAARANVEAAELMGSGPGGRVFVDDVGRGQTRAAAPSGSAPAAAAPRAPVSSWTPAAGVVAATPMAKKLAKEKKVDIQVVRGTGNFGRVTEDDVKRHLGMPVEADIKAQKKAAAAEAVAAQAAPAKAADGGKAKEAKGPPPPPASAVDPSLLGQTLPMDALQKAVSKNMVASMEAPIFRVSRSICTDKFDQLYKDLKPKGVTVSALLAKAAGIAVDRHRLVNAAFDSAGGGAVKHPKNVNVAMAVATPDGGLITPVLQRAEERDIFDLSRNWKELVDKARQKKLSPQEYNSGTFYITNLGMFGVDSFEAILPAGSGTIMAVGAAKPVVAFQENGFMGVRKEMTVTLTCDHRHIYGSHAAEFLKTFAEILETEPERTLMFS